MNLSNGITINAQASILGASIVIAAVGSAPATLAQYQYFEESSKLTASDAAEDDHFGSSVAIHNGLVIVGAPVDDDNGTHPGSAYIYNAATAEELHKLTASDGSADDDFGTSVAIDGGYAIVGAHGESDNGSNSGAAYIFDSSTGAQLLKLTASDAAAEGWFGSSVAIHNGLVIVGAFGDDENGPSSGAAYIVDVSTGEELFKLTASDGGTGDNFGYSVAISNGLVIVGAPFEDHNGAYSGSAYVFDVTTGDELFKLTASDAAAYDIFGYSVAIDADVAIVGAVGNDDKGDSSGSAYLFDLTTGEELRKLIASDGAQGDSLGTSVALDGGLALVGASDCDSPADNAGAAYLFDITTGEEILKLTASDAAADDRFGGSMAIENGLAIVGSRFDDDNGDNSGSAYLFAAAPELIVNPVPLVALEHVTFSGYSLTPNKRAWLLYSFEGLGMKFIPKLNVVVDLLNPKIAHTKKTDADGFVQWDATAPWVGNSKDIWFQLIQHSRGTNYIATQIVP